MDQGWIEQTVHFISEGALGYPAMTAYRRLIANKAHS
jgi:hypothetical protein